MQVFEIKALAFCWVPGAGVEPAHPFGHWCLRPTRLPIPPSGRLSACLDFVADETGADLLRIAKVLQIVLKINFFFRKTEIICKVGYTNGCNCLHNDRSSQGETGIMTSRNTEFFHFSCLKIMGSLSLPNA